MPKVEPDWYTQVVLKPDLIINRWRIEQKWPTFCRWHFEMHFLDFFPVFFYSIIVIIHISLKCVSKDAIDNKSALVQIMAWRWVGRPRYMEPYVITRPQWVTHLLTLWPLPYHVQRNGEKIHDLAYSHDIVVVIYPSVLPIFLWTLFNGNSIQIQIFSFQENYSHFLQWFQKLYTNDIQWYLLKTWLLWWQIRYTLTNDTPYLALKGKTWHDGVIKWKHFPPYWPFVWGINRSPVNSLTKANDTEL